MSTMKRRSLSLHGAQVPCREDVVADPMPEHERRTRRDIQEQLGAAQFVGRRPDVVDGVVEPQREFDGVAIVEQRRHLVAPAKAILDMAEIVKAPERRLVAACEIGVHGGAVGRRRRGDAALPELREAGCAVGRHRTRHGAGSVLAALRESVGSIRPSGRRAAAGTLLPPLAASPSALPHPAARRQAGRCPCSRVRSARASRAVRSRDCRSAGAGTRRPRCAARARAPSRGPSCPAVRW